MSKRGRNAFGPNWPRGPGSDPAAKSPVPGVNRFPRDTSFMPASVVFHSFRHASIDLVREARIPREVRQAITGRTGAGAERRRRKRDEGDECGRGFEVAVPGKQIAMIKPLSAIPTPTACGRTGA